VVHTCCLSESRVYTRAGFTLPECTCGLSKDSPRGPRADLLKVNTHPKNEMQRKNKELNSWIGEFVLTWSRRKFVSSTVAPGITVFIKGGLLAP
jgi:hypothetical protein